MVLQRTGLRKFPTALTTRIRTFAGMRTEVFRQAVRAVKLHAADVAGKRFLAGVNSQVLLQVSRSTKLPTAYVAGERAFPGVCPNVFGQVAGFEEFPTADVAGEWAFIGMCSHVPFHPVYVDKFIAHHAGKPTSVIVNRYTVIAR